MSITGKRTVARSAPTRIRIDLIAVYSIAPNMRIGAGAQLVAKPELKGTGH